MTITAEINPVPLARARVNTKNRGRYLPERSRRFKADLQQAARLAMGDLSIFTAQLKVSIHFYKPLKNLACRNFGDIDNHCKAVLDAFNGVVWADDSQVVELHAFKCHGSARLEINIEEV